MIKVKELFRVRVKEKEQDIVLALLSFEWKCLYSKFFEFGKDRMGIHTYEIPIVMIWSRPKGQLSLDTKERTMESRIMVVNPNEFRIILSKLRFKHVYGSLQP